MALNYHLREAVQCKSPEEMGEIMDKLERAVEIRYVESVPLEVGKSADSCSTQISPNDSCSAHIFSYKIREDTEEGRMTRITYAAAGNVKFEVGDEPYQIFFSERK